VPPSPLFAKESGDINGYIEKLKNIASEYCQMGGCFNEADKINCFQMSLPASYNGVKNNFLRLLEEERIYKELKRSL